MSQIQKLKEKLDGKFEDITPSEDNETQVEVQKQEEDKQVEKIKQKSLTEKLSDNIIDKMPYATDEQKHRATQVIMHLMAKISGNPQVFAMFTDKSQVANTARIVTQIVNLDLPFAASDMYYLIPYKNTLSLQLSYQGMMEIAYRAGVYNVQVNTVYNEDHFEFSYGNTNHFVHRPAFSSDVPRLYYATCKVVVAKENELLLVVMSHEQMLKFKQKYSRGNPLWNSDFESMAKKTVIKQLLKLCPKRPIDSELLQEQGDD